MINPGKGGKNKKTQARCGLDGASRWGRGRTWSLSMSWDGCLVGGGES